MDALLEVGPVRRSLRAGDRARSRGAEDRARPISDVRAAVLEDVAQIGQGFASLHCL
jgi:hypothetical protein